MMMAADPPATLANEPAFNLVRDPFAPEFTTPAGKERYYYSGSGPLDPRSNAAHLGFYLDVYEWHDPGKVGGMRPDGRLAALERNNPGRSMILLVSGFSGCGRSSAINLLLYEIENRMGHAPLRVDYSVSITATLVQHAISIAQLLMDAAAPTATLATNLERRLDRWLKYTPAGLSPDPDGLFQALKTAIPAGLGVVTVLDAANHKVPSETWRKICEILAHISDFIIVSLSDRQEAELFRSILSRGQYQVGWIDAPKITEDKMTKLLALRLEHERMAKGASPTPLAPFTAAALSALYQRGKGATQPVSWPIAVAMGWLAKAFAAKSRVLTDAVNNGRQPAAAEIEITANDMENVIAGR